jgi:hypothetical protein
MTHYGMGADRIASSSATASLPMSQSLTVVERNDFILKCYGPRLARGVTAAPLTGPVGVSRARQKRRFAKIPCNIPCLQGKRAEQAAYITASQS